MPGQHLAAISLAKGSKLEIQDRPTPTPGPNELLIEVKAIALNPVDGYQRDFGAYVAGYPAVLGSDVAGVVVEAGSSVASDSPTPGTRVTAFAPAFYQQGSPNYGAFQSYVLVPSGNAAAIPGTLSFSEAAIFPMAVATAWAGFYSIGVARDPANTPADRRGILVWGAASSVGSAVVQVAKSLGFKVYAVASQKHWEHLKTLGASEVFDYKEPNVVEKIVKGVQIDGVSLTTGYDAVGQLPLSMEVLKYLKGDRVSKIASAVPLPGDLPKVDGVEARFVMAPDGDEARTEYFHFVFSVWLKQKLAKGEFVPNSKVKAVGKGLNFIDGGLDELKKGVSGEKLVIEL